MKANGLIRQEAVSRAFVVKAGKTSRLTRTSTATRLTATLNSITQQEVALVVCRFIGKMVG